MAVNPVPEGFHRITPYLTAEGADELASFLKRALGAVEKDCLRRPDGKIAHAVLQIGDSRVMLSEECGEWKAMTAALYVYVDDTDATYRAAIAAGATSVMEPADQFYGDRNAGVRDPKGNLWWIGTHIEDVGPEELERRMADAIKEREAQHAAAR